MKRLSYLFLILLASYCAAAPAPLERQPKHKKPTARWPVGRTVRDHTRYLTTHFQLGGSCTCYDGRRVFPGKWWYDDPNYPDEVIVAFGHNWEDYDDGRPFQIRYWKEE